MKRIGLVFIGFVLTVSGFAQKTAEIGIWGGSSLYWGDVKEVPPMQTFNLNLGAFFRYNFHKRVALRAMFLTGNFSAEGYNQDVPWDFSKNAQDLSLMAEVNYLKYMLGNKKTPFTSYILGGIGVMYYSFEVDDTDLVRLALINQDYPLMATVKESVIAPAIPFGFGFKFHIGERLGIGAEYLMRKIFNDKLDDLDDPLAYSKTNDDGTEELVKYSDFLHNNDWPGYLGVHVTYKFYLSKKACPAYDRKYW